MYANHLGLTLSPYCRVDFEWCNKDSPETLGKTVWALFPSNTEYFGAGPQRAMVNYRVDDLDGLLQQLEAGGMGIDLRRQKDENWRFAWIIDPEGNRVELWEPSQPKATS